MVYITFKFFPCNKSLRDTTPNARKIILKTRQVKHGWFWTFLKTHSKLISQQWQILGVTSNCRKRRKSITKIKAEGSQAITCRIIVQIIFMDSRTYQNHTKNKSNSGTYLGSFHAQDYLKKHKMKRHLVKWRKYWTIFGLKMAGLKIQKYWKTSRIVTYDVCINSAM